MVGQLFTILLFASCTYAWIAGGKEGRWVCLLIISAALATIPASRMGYAWERVQLPVLIVDILLFIALGVIAIRSRRYWPLWMTAFHLVSVSTHVARVAEADLPPRIYFALQAFWSLPVLLVMVAGIMLDRRAGLPKFAPWKPLTHERGAPS